MDRKWGGAQLYSKGTVDYKEKQKITEAPSIHPVLFEKSMDLQLLCYVTVRGEVCMNLRNHEEKISKLE